MLDIKSDTEFQDIIDKCYDSLEEMAYTLFPDTFFLPFSDGHREIMRILDDDSIQQAVISAPRGFGKSTLCTLKQSSDILFRRRKFIIPVSNSSTQAVLDSESLKDELLTNEAVTQLFGMRKARKADVRSDFSKESWIMYTPEDTAGTMILPRGSGQKIRGIKFGRHRPGLIIVDDLEDDEAVESEEQRAKLKRWFFSSLKGSVDKHSRNWRIVVVGTPLHEDSLLRNLIEDDNWESLELSICTEQYVSNWPELYSDDDIKAMVNEYKDQGELDLFYREYMGRHIATEDAVFKSEYWSNRYYDEGTEKLWENKDIVNVVILDPAKTVKIHSSETAIMCIGIDAMHRRLYIRDLVAEKLYPDEIYKEFFGMIDRFHAKVAGVEVTSLNEFIKQPMENQMMMENRNVHIEWLEARGKKEERAAALVPYYRQGLVWHNMIATGPLEAQLLSFPRSKRWDCIDVLAYVIILMEKLGIYFHHQSWQEYVDNTAQPELESAMGMDFSKPLEGWRIQGV